MLNCAIYPRKSKAVDNSDSMDTQIDMCIRYLDDKIGKNNYSVTIYDKDYGITGHSTKQRKDFQRMMQDIKDKKIQLVLIQRYDRIARNVRDFCNLYYDMEKNGCNLVSVSQQIDTSTPYGKNFMYMQASMAELEWALSSERRKDANKYARSIGKCTLSNQSIPLGYKAEYIDGIRRMIKDPEKEDVIIDIFDHYKKYSNYCGAAKFINNKYGLKITNNTVKNIIKNTCYYGEYGGNVSFCEPYISKQEWSNLQIYRAVIRNDKRKSTEILFSGLIRCPECRRLMRFMQKTSKNGNIYRYSHCEYHSAGTCNYKKVKSELLLESMLIDYLNRMIKEINSKSEEREEKNKNYSAKIKSLNEEKERLNTMFLKGRISEKDYDAEYVNLESLIAEYEAYTSSQGQQIKAFSYFNHGWEIQYKELDKLNKKIFWKNILKEIIVDSDMNVVGIIFLE